jgi:DNA-binding NtrC family response regulator/CHASE2 domain-containing sensor protein
MERLIQMQSRWQTAGLIGLAATAFVGLLWVFGAAVLDPWEWSTYDRRLGWIAGSKTDTPILIIGRDADSDERFKGGLWDRERFATVIAALGRARAAVIVLDFHFSGESPVERGGGASDRALADAMRSSGSVVVPLPVTFQSAVSSDSNEANVPSFDDWMAHASVNRTDAVTSIARPTKVMSVSLPLLSQSAQGVGHIAAASDVDGVYRHVPVLVDVQGHALPALGVAAAAAYLHVPVSSLTIGSGDALEFPSGTDAAQSGPGLILPLDREGRMLVRYAGRWSEHPFPYLSFVDVWDAVREHREAELREQVEGKIVLLMHASLESDKRRTPLDLTAPGGFVHANVMHTILSGQGLRPLSLTATIAISLILGTLAAWVWLTSTMWLSAIGIGVGALAYGAIATSAMTAGVVLPVLPVLGAVMLSSGLALGWLRWRGGQELQALEKEQISLQSTIAEKQERLAHQEAQVDRLTEDLAALGDEVLTGKQQTTNLTQRIDELQVQLRTAEEQEAANRQGLETLTDELVASRSAAVERQAHHKAQVDRLTEVLAALGEEVSTGEQRTTNLTQRTNELQVQLRTAEEQEAATRQVLKKLEAQLVASRSAAVERVSVLDKELAGLQQECEQYEILTRDVGLLSLFKVLKKIAGFRMSVLLLGEPGTGKELFARATHAMSPRKNGPFVAVNMASIAPELFESEMFGHVKGSFTGAVRDRIGYFKQADGGTLFLDEIGDLRPDHQAKLLRVLQEGVYCRVGDGTPVRVDVRIVSATNRDLLQDIAQGRFREDLYGRLNGHEVRLSPLRQRIGDIHLLANRLIQKFAQAHGKAVLELSKSALAAMERHPWKNNIRELESCIEKAVILAEGSHIQVEDLRLSAQKEAPAPAGQVVASDMPPSASASDALKEDPALLLWLRRHGFDHTATAAELRCDRSTVMQRVKGMGFQALVRHGGDRRAAALSLAGEAGLARLVEVKISEYADHLTTVARSYESADLAIKGCRKRFKNLPERYTVALDTLIRQAYAEE